MVEYQPRKFKPKLSTNNINRKKLKYLCISLWNTFSSRAQSLSFGGLYDVDILEGSLDSLILFAFSFLMRQFRLTIFGKNAT